MRIITMLCLLITPLYPQNQIDKEQIAKLLNLSGLRLEIEDHTERESRVRNIHFKKVVYVRAPGENYIYPMVLWIAPKGAIDIEKYSKIRELHKNANYDYAKAMKNIGSAYFPELDNAVVSLDQIQMTTRQKTSAIEGDPWIYITPFVGGLSITGTNEQMELDYQILMTGAVERDPELGAKFRIASLVETDEIYLQRMKNLLILVRDSPLMASAAIKVSSRDERREVRHDPRDEKNSNSGVSGAPAERSISSSAPIWPWIASLFIIIGMVIFLVRRSKR